MDSEAKVAKAVERMLNKRNATQATLRFTGSQIATVPQSDGRTAMSITITLVGYLDAPPNPKVAKAAQRSRGHAHP